MTSAKAATSPSKPALAAIILAAGYSSRMGAFKPLLMVGGKPAVQRSVELFQRAGVQDVIVVTGHRGEEIRVLVEACGARAVFNAEFDLGMYSSVCAGVNALLPGTAAAFVLPADMPLVRPGTVRQLAAEFDGNPAAILYPTFADHRGHPPLIGREVLDKARRFDPVGMLRSLLAGYERGAREVFVPDECIHLDMDTPEDFAELQEIACTREIPTLFECEEILRVYQGDAQLAQHSRVVGDIAHRLCTALVKRGIKLCPELARAGGMLHDICKGAPHHAEAGEQLLRKLGFPCVAAVVGVHMEFTMGNALSEGAMVYLADKLVSGDRVVGLANRFHGKLERFRDNPVALAAALRRRAAAEAVAQEVERQLQTNLFHVIGLRSLAGAVSLDS